MSRTNGPVKGLVVFTCQDSAITSSYIVEPLLLSASDFAAMEAGGSFTGTLIPDTATQTHYVTLTNGSVDAVPINNVYLGIGDGSVKTFGVTLTGLPVKASSLTVTAGGVTGTAGATGTITGAGISSGSVVISTGVVTVTFTAAPAHDTPVLLAYTRGV